MARDSAPLVKIIAGLLYPADRPDLLDWSRDRLRGEFGPVERESRRFRFDFTDYYRDISPSLERVFFSFCRLAGADCLAAWKRAAIRLERESGQGGRVRCVNIDPGYVDGARLVLASTKDNGHRICIAADVFAEITMSHRKGVWEKYPNTYPDFRSSAYDGFFETVYKDWRNDIKFIGVSPIDRRA